MKAQASQDYYTTEAHAVVVVWFDHASAISLNKPDGTVLSSTAPNEQSRSVAMSVPLSSLALGRNLLVATMEGWQVTGGTSERHGSGGDGAASPPFQRRL